MSQEELERWRASFDELARAGEGDLDPQAASYKMSELWAPEIEWDMSEAPVFDIQGVYRGIEAGRQLWREWFSAWETLRFEYQLVDAGDRVVALIDLRMRGRSTGIEMPLGKHAFVATFRKGLMVHSKLYMNQSVALEAAGVFE
jgi:hypothetical protein